MRSLHKIMLSRRPSEGWLLLDKTGLLPLIFPELAALKGVEVKSGRGHKDVFLHTLQVVDNVAMRQPSAVSIQPSDHELWLRWAALLHDIGKPRSKAWDPQAGWTFRNHNYIGSKMIPKIFRTMKLPLNEKMQYVQKMVDLHMRPIHLIEDTVTDSAVRRLLFEAGDDIEDLMLLCDADITSRNEEKVARFHRNYQARQGEDGGTRGARPHPQFPAACEGRGDHATVGLGALLYRRRTQSGHKGRYIGRCDPQ